MRALTMGQILTRGELTTATNISMALPNLVARQAYWEFDLALCLLESGSPDHAAEFFTHVLKLVPDIAVRPIIAYYLEKMGKPVPELPAKSTVTLPGAGRRRNHCWELDRWRHRLLQKQRHRLRTRAVQKTDPNHHHPPEKQRRINRTTKYTKETRNSKKRT